MTKVDDDRALELVQHIVTGKSYFPLELDHAEIASLRESRILRIAAKNTGGIHPFRSNDRRLQNLLEACSVVPGILSFEPDSDAAPQHGTVTLNFNAFIANHPRLVRGANYRAMDHSGSLGPLSEGIFHLSELLERTGYQVRLLPRDQTLSGPAEVVIEPIAGDPARTPAGLEGARGALKGLKLGDAVVNGQEPGTGILSSRAIEENATGLRNHAEALKRQAANPTLADRVRGAFGRG